MSRLGSLATAFVIVLLLVLVVVLVLVLEFVSNILLQKLPFLEHEDEYEYEYEKNYIKSNSYAPRPKPDTGPHTANTITGPRKVSSTLEMA